MASLWFGAKLSLPMLTWRHAPACLRLNHTKIHHFDTMINKIMFILIFVQINSVHRHLISLHTFIFIQSSWAVKLLSFFSSRGQLVVLTILGKLRPCHKNDRYLSLFSTIHLSPCSKGRHATKIWITHDQLKSRDPFSKASKQWSNMFFEWMNKYIMKSWLFDAEDGTSQDN